MITRPLGQYEDWQAIDTGQRIDFDDMLEQAILFREWARQQDRKEVPARNTRTPCEQQEKTRALSAFSPRAHAK